jgi:hypothetical protein
MRRAAACALVLLSLMACARGDTPALRGIAPAGAERLEERGSWDVALSGISTEVVADLRHQAHDDLDGQRWKMPAGAGFDQACADLQRALGAGWRPLEPAKLPQHGVDARRCGWREPAVLGHDRVFVLAWGEVPVRLAANADPVRLAVTVFTRDR